MASHKLNIDEIYFIALEKADDEERTAYLDVACGDDSEFRARVERLLNARPKVENFLESPAPGINVSPAIDRPITEKAGTQIGPYKLLQQIGEGGFGLVYMAEQQEPVQRKVALKIIKPGMDTREVIGRFEAERQALALMDHPNIARVLDAGATELGQPYFVMELVRGIPITEYCDQNNLSTPQRLDLFITVCQAVQHAHQKGVIHRDIKPTNVMITLHDGRPVVKVIDFGVAKAINQKLTERTLFTNYAQMIGTPLYMSPEQAEMSGLDVDTRTDIYALGVLLYELLTGETPFDKERLREAAYDEIRRIIREEDPPKPSTKISSLGKAATMMSAHRQCDPKRLSALVRGDLDWIAMKALEKDRTRRYETASALARDIERYQNEEPVEACPPTKLYRVRKFVRRNKVTFSMSAVVATTLLLTGLIGIWLAIRATRAEHVAEQRFDQEQKAHHKADQSRQLADQERLLAERRLLDSYLSEARARRRDGIEGRRLESMVRIREAALLARTLEVGEEAVLELRNEAIASMALLDLRPDRKWPGHPPRVSHNHVGFDRALELYARLEPNGFVVVRRMSDNEEVARIPGSGNLYVRPELRFSPDGKLLAVRASSGRPNESEIKVWDLSEYLGAHKKTRNEYVWFDDRLPTGAQETHTGQWGAWQFVEHPVFSGRRATVRTCQDLGQHSFEVAIAPLRIGEGDSLFAHIYLDPENPPKEIMLQVSDGTWEHRAFWGDDLINWGEPDSSSRRRQGALPEAGKWVRLEVNLEEIGITSGAHLGGLAFTQFDGTVYWDKAGIVTETPQVALAMQATSNGPSSGLQAIDFSSDSTLLATEIDGEICVFDARTGRLEKQFAAAQDSVVRMVRFNHDGNQIAIGHESLVSIYETKTGKELASFPQTNLRTFAWSSDGRYLGTGGSDKEITIWDVELGTPSAVCLGHDGTVNNMTFNQAGDLLASWSWDGTTRIWNPRTGQLLLTTSGWAVQFSDDDRFLGFAHAGKEFGRREVVRSKALRIMNMHDRPHPVHRVGFSADGQVLVSGTDSDGVRFWNADNAAEIAHLGMVRHAVFDDGGKRMFTAGPGGFASWDVESDTADAVLRVGFARQLLATEGFGGWIKSEAALSRDQRTLAVTESYGNLAFLDTVSGEIKRKIKALGYLEVSISPDGHWAAAAPWNSFSLVTIWDLDTGEVETQLPLPTSRSGKLSFSPDGKWLVTSDLANCTFWTVGSWQPSHVLPGTGPIVFAPEANQFAITSEGLVHLYDVKSMHELAILESPNRHLITSLCFDAHGTRLAAGTSTGTVHLWDLGYIREQLAGMGLDWDQAPYPPANQESVPSLKIEFDFGDQWQLWYEHARALAADENWEQAIANYSKAIELGQNQSQETLDAARAQWAELHNLLAWTLCTCPRIGLRDGARAVELAKQAAELLPEGAHVWNTLGAAHVQARQWEEAIESLEKSMRLQAGGDSFDWFLLAIAHWQLGNRDQARQWYVKATVWMEKNEPDDQDLIRFRNEAGALLHEEE